MKKQVYIKDHGFWYSLEGCFAIFFANYKSISIRIHIIRVELPEKEVEIQEEVVLEEEFAPVL